jgi:ABC-type uncharacterized transport system substrate-binding protein
VSTRREFITLLGGAVAAWPLVARAQTQQLDRVRRISVLISNADGDEEASARVKALDLGLQKLGWNRNRNLFIEYRFGVNEPDQAIKVARDLVGLAPEVILAHTPATIAALKKATQSIPIVFVQSADPVALGFVDNLAKPEGNVTGFVLFEPSIGEKWVQLLHDVSPNVREVLVMQSANNPGSAGFMQTIEAAAPRFGIEISSATVQDSAEIEKAIASFSARPNVGMIVLPGPIFGVLRKRMIATAKFYKIPSIYPFPYFARDGGLVSYSPDNIDQWRQAASYVDRILRGARTQDLPIQLPTQFLLIINLKTAQAIDLSIHRDVLLVADEIIE